MFVGTTLIPVHQALRGHPRCSHRFVWIRNIVPKEAFESTHGVFQEKRKRRLKNKENKANK